MDISGADISASASIDRTLVWNFRMSWAATDVSDWLLQLLLPRGKTPQQTINHSSVTFSIILLDYYGR